MGVHRSRNSFGTAADAGEQGNLFKNCVQAYQVAGFGKFDIEETHWPIGRVVIRAAGRV